MTQSEQSNSLKPAAKRGARLAGRGLFLTFMLFSVFLGVMAVALGIVWLALPPIVVLIALVALVLAVIVLTHPRARP